MPGRNRRLPTWKVCTLALWLLAPAGSSLAQTGTESNVGYIDGAIPVNRVRLRADLDYNYPFPDRGEFTYSHSPMKPGESAELRADQQEFFAYLELALAKQFSIFAEVPVRALSPTLDPNATGLSDVNAGFKYAFLSEDDYVASFQLRVIAPTGSKSLHLGSGHASIEPALLGYAHVTEELAVEGELRLWIPVGGEPSYDSHLVRYGVGASYQALATEQVKVFPVLELVGWTFLDGQKSINAPDGTGVVVGAGGDTIVNAKLGVRFRTDYGDFYVGYGRALTGVPFYKDIVRAEYRCTW
jgi:hypothetical protein